MSLKRGTAHIPPGVGFLCRYVERTIAQLGEEALELPLVARHLTDCPACRAQRRRVSNVDRAFRTALLRETPCWYEGRWEDLCERIPDLQRRPPRQRRERSLVLGTVAALLVLLGGAWLADHAGERVATGEALAGTSGVTVTEVAVHGSADEVQVDTQVDEEGAVVLWVRPETTGRSEAGGLK
jgi:anti-sigma factor RsiW